MGEDDSTNIDWQQRYVIEQKKRKLLELKMELKEV